jgi:L-ascorbate metabolism protein UlaG (beta-lactamase superfamily)
MTILYVPLALGFGWISLGIILGSLLIFFLGIVAFTRLHPQFGGRVRQEDLARFAKSKQWNGKIFENRSRTEMSIKPSQIFKLIGDRKRAKEWSAPQEDIPVIPFDKATFLADGPAKYIWYGHSVILLRMGGKTILIDPMMSEDATAIAPMKTKRFSSGTLEILDQLPEIDILCMSHDHYDHLDYPSIQKLKHKTKHYYVALGVGRHLQRWGIAADKITELDWWDTVAVGDLQLTFTESRHFSGRGLTDRFKSLWGGWIIASPACKVYWSGDGGYDAHFKEIGAQYGPFDIGFMECGQYHENWSLIHMLPEESVGAAQEAGVKVAVPVHCLGFALALHPWQEPQERFLKAAEAAGLQAYSPAIGAIVAIG